MTLLTGAIALFAITNVDDLIVLALFFGRARESSDRRKVVAGQLLGVGAIVAVATLAGGAASALSDRAIAWLGVIPIGIGLAAAWRLRRGADGRAERRSVPAPSVATVAAVTVANGGDNLGVYVPVFAAAGLPAIAGYAAVFLVLSLVWCAIAVAVTARPRVAASLDRWGDRIYPVVLVVLGVIICVSGGAFS